MIRNLLRLIGLLGLGLVAGCGGGDNPAATKTATPPAPALAISSAAPPSGGVGTSYAGNGFSLTASGGPLLIDGTGRLRRAHRCQLD